MKKSSIGAIELVELWIVYSLEWKNFKKMKFKVTVFILTLFISSLRLLAQEVNHSIGLYSLVSENTPFWLQTNRFGAYDSDGTGLVGSVNSVFKQNFSDNFSFTSEVRLLSRLSENPTFYFPFIYASVNYKRLHLSVGRFYEGRNQQLENISTGSLTISKNSVPIPRMLLTTEYISVPFTQDYLKIKGSFGHGVMED